ncbi:CinA family nicotinamide mononucleotide deamidase-related protein [Flavobacterium sp. CBA20B-1]|uniref:CinA family nicotinamide mononucleotide deamidase-related protein n=1 Tax=unclassified Flavobacterium TaxID=196869 RepID=UPI002223FB40|nr:MULTISPECIES: CinA family nicotinamide mononucleotide deamidase-related protein [unclassified Flavobacterium]WCM42133.1 CinA family nicotinamide mononucleotide deamidase-related protein [Flavobacterium sp. CBA20B-1]
MKAAIITIGDELLIGQVVDTNSVFIGQQLEAIGCKVIEKIAVSDTFHQIIETFEKYQNKVDLVIITGGLGPTKDDITKKTFAHYFNDELVMNTAVLDHVTQLIANYYNRPLNEMNRLQALVPSRCEVLFNDVGTAPGMLMVKEQTVFVSLPGVPYEMKYLITEKLFPYIKKHFQLDAIVHKTVLTVGIGESMLAEKIALWEDSLQLQNIHLAYLPQFGLVRLRLSKTGDSVEEITQEIDEKIKELQQLIPTFFIGVTNTDTLFDEVVQLLKKSGLTLATAESCTGGSIAQKLTSIEGASAYFKGSAVTYATESKVNVLGVQQQTIDTYSVVSQEVAKEMAVGAKKIFQTDLAIATTGNAGPLKGDADAEVGTVCIAFVYEDKVESFTYNFGKPRHKVIQAAVEKTWLLLYQYIRLQIKST